MLQSHPRKYLSVVQQALILIYNNMRTVFLYYFLTEPPMDHSDLVAELLKELSNHNERVEERKAALYELMKLTQEESFGVWDEHFKTILLLLLETLGDKEVNSD